MLRKDYYVILGIPRGECFEGIRAAYRDLAESERPRGESVLRRARG